MLRLVHNASVDKQVNKTGNGYMSSGMQFHRGDNESRRGCFNVQFRDDGTEEKTGDPAEDVQSSLSASRMSRDVYLDMDVLLLYRDFRWNYINRDYVESLSCRAFLKRF